MILKLVSSMAGDRFSFRPGQVIKCSDVTGGRLIEAGHAKEAKEGAEIEGELYDEPAEENLGQEQRRVPERATTPAPETPEDRKPAAFCQGTTTMGNPCRKAALPESEFCAKHQPE